MLIAVDVDDVCADLVTTWLHWYNFAFGDSIEKSSIVAWDISKFVKPECGKKIYEFLDSRKLYDDVFPIEGSLQGVRQLRDGGHRVVFVTSSVNGVAGRKLRWLQEWEFIPAQRKSEPDYVECHDKSLIRADVLIDDGAHNLRAFKGHRIQFLQPWNVNEFVPGAWLANGWREIPKIIQDMGWSV